MKIKNRIALTKEEADFIAALIIKNDSIIRYQIHKYIKGDLYDHLCEECISNIYLVACKNVKKIRKHENPDGWIAVTSRYMAKNMLRKELQKNNKIVHDDFAVVNPTEDDIFEEALYSIWLEEDAISKLLGKLTPREREIYDMIYIKKMKAKEIAEEFGITESTVWNTNRSIKEKITYAIKKNDF